MRFTTYLVGATIVIGSYYLTANASELDCTVTRIIDGDTVECTNHDAPYQKTVRISDIDAPEKGQPYGQEANDILEKVLLDREVIVHNKGTDRYGRTIGEIELEKQNVGLLLVVNGYAWHYAKYSNNSAFITAQDQAKKEHLGLWDQENPKSPWDFRKEKTKISD